MFSIRCYLNVIALYTALELDVMIEHFRLTRIEGLLLNASFNLILNPIYYYYVCSTFSCIISHSELHLLRLSAVN